MRRRTICRQDYRTTYKSQNTTQELKNWADELRTGPASSRCNQCDCIGPRVSGDPSLRSNSVETVYKIWLLANSALVRTNIDTKDGRLCPQTQTFYSSPKTLTVNTKRKFFVLTVVTLYYTTSTRLYSEKRTAVNRATVEAEWQWRTRK